MSKTYTITEDQFELLSEAQGCLAQLLLQVQLKQIDPVFIDKAERASSKAYNVALKIEGII